jgi:hypothetical protein
MNRSAKAALLSGLVFPGVGQLFLKRPLRAMIFLLPALLASLYFTHIILQPVMAIAADIQSGMLALDPLLIHARIEQSRVDTGAMNLAAIVLVAAWLVSTVDAWWLGRAHEVVAAK